MTTRQLVTAAEITEAYLDGFAASGLAASTILEGVRPSVVDTTYFGRSLSRPVFLSHQQIEQLGTDLVRLHDALTGLSRRIFNGNMTTYARAVGVSERQIEVVLRGTGAVPSRMSRVDM